MKRVGFTVITVHDYFLGATTPIGFSSFFEQLIDNDYPLRTYIIKAGPGCGKSSLMNRIADRVKAAGYGLEMIRCASDPSSLDGIICSDLNFAIVDGSAPHVLEPPIPAAKQEVVSLYHCIDNKRMTEAFGELRPLFDLNGQYVSRARRFIAAAGSLNYDIERTAQTALVLEKINRYAKNLAVKELPKKSGTGREALRFVSAFTPAGIVDYTESNYGNCKSVHILEDRYGAYAHACLEIIRSYALSAGYDVTVCRSPMSAYDKIDVVYIPETDTAFIHSGYIFGVSIPNAHVVRDRRFYNTETISTCQKRLAFCKKASLELISEACALMSEAKLVHDEIEKHYIAAVNFDKIREREEDLVSDLGLAQ